MKFMKAQDMKNSLWASRLKSLILVSRVLHVLFSMTVMTSGFYLTDFHLWTLVGIHALLWPLLGAMIGWCVAGGCVLPSLVYGCWCLSNALCCHGGSTVLLGRAGLHQLCWCGSHDRPWNHARLWRHRWDSDPKCLPRGRMWLGIIVTVVILWGFVSYNYICSNIQFMQLGRK